MKREIQDCLSALFLFIGYSSIFHQRMNGNEKIRMWHREKTHFLFSLAVIFFSLPRNSDETMMKE